MTLKSTRYDVFRQYLEINLSLCSMTHLEMPKDTGWAQHKHIVDAAWHTVGIVTQCHRF